MNATERHVLDGEPVPVDPQGRLALACAFRVDGEWRTGWLLGTRKEAFGPAYATAREAARAARYLNERSEA